MVESPTDLVCGRNRPRLTGSGVGWCVWSPARSEPCVPGLGAVAGWYESFEVLRCAGRSDQAALDEQAAALKRDTRRVSSRDDGCAFCSRPASQQRRKSCVGRLRFDDSVVEHGEEPVAMPCPRTGELR